MMPEDSIWMYDPSFALAIVGCVVYSLLFIAITHLTFIRYRSWYFTVVVVGAAIEVAGYASRVYSTKNQSELVSIAICPWCTLNKDSCLQDPLHHNPHAHCPRPNPHRRWQLPPHQPPDSPSLASCIPPNLWHPRPQTHSNFCRL